MPGTGKSSAFGVSLLVPSHGIYVGAGAITLPVVAFTRIPGKPPSSGSGSTPLPPQYRGWYKRRLPLITPLPAGSASFGVPSRHFHTPLVVAPPVLPVGAIVLSVRPPLAPHTTQASLLFRPLVVAVDHGGLGAVYSVRPPLKPPAPSSHAVILPLIVRSDYERGGTVLQVRPPLKPPPVGVPGFAVLLEPLVVRSDSPRAGSVTWERPPLKPAPLVPGFAVLMEPMVVRSDYRQEARVFWQRPPFLPPRVGVPGFVVLLQPRIIIGPRPPKGVGILEGLARFTVYPPTPTGIVGPRLQFYRGLEADRPNLLIAEPSWTIDAHGLWVGDGTYDRFIGGDLVSPPAHSNSTGTMGQCAWDGTYFYRCVATNTWIRIAGITSW